MAIKKQRQSRLTDNYFLKFVVILILGCLWIKIGRPNEWQVPIPLGLIVGTYLISKDKLKIDRKIEYAVLLVAMLVGFWAPIGLYIKL